MVVMKTEINTLCATAGRTALHSVCMYRSTFGYLWSIDFCYSFAVMLCKAMTVMTMSAVYYYCGRHGVWLYVGEE